MEFNEKLQELRKQKGLTQEELAECLYVSRTAISKWESGRGYPSIESLKMISKFFSVTLDDLLSSETILTIAEQEGKQKEKRLCDLLFGLLDFMAFLLLFLPLFAERNGDTVNSVSLLMLDGASGYIKVAYYSIVIITVATGILTLALQNFKLTLWAKSKTLISLIIGTLAVFLFILSLQPYAAVFSFVLLAIKVFMYMTRIVSHA